MTLGLSYSAIDLRVACQRSRPSLHSRQKTPASDEIGPSLGRTTPVPLQAVQRVGCSSSVSISTICMCTLPPFKRRTREPTRPCDPGENAKAHVVRLCKALRFTAAIPRNSQAWNPQIRISLGVQSSRIQSSELTSSEFGVHKGGVQSSAFRLLFPFA